MIVVEQYENTSLLKVYSDEGKPLLQEDTDTIVWTYNIENPGEHTYKELEWKDVPGFVAAWNDENTEEQLGEDNGL